MIISDEQYEELERRIENLTIAMSYLVVGKTILIDKKDFAEFSEKFGDGTHLLIQTSTKNGLFWVWRLEESEQSEEI